MKKALNLPILISLVVGNMIGTGIYLLPASLAAFGAISILGWVYTSLGAILLALTFANLSQSFPKTGGPYAYCKEAFGPFIGFIIAIMYWLSNLVSVAGIAVSSIGYLGFLTPHLDANSTTYNQYLGLTIELIAVWFFTLLNIIGLHAAGLVQIFLTIVKLAPLFLVTLLGLSHMHIVNFGPWIATNEPSAFKALGSAAALTFWAFIGLESATVPAENTDKRDIYKATIIGTVVTAFIYICSTVVLMGMIPNAILKNSQFPFAEAGTMLFGTKAALIIAICAVISGLGALNVTILIQGQIAFAAARDKLFPSQLASLTKTGTPAKAQILSSSLVTLLLIMTVEPTLLQQFNNIALFAGLLTMITYFTTTLAELYFLLREKTPVYYIFKSKSFWITVLATIYSIWMLTNFDNTMLKYAGILLLVSVPLYFLTVARENRI